MTSTRIFLATVLVGTLSAAAWAQPGPGERERRGGMRRGPGPDRGRWAERMIEHMADELDLDEEQRAQFAEITAEQRQGMREMGERWREIRQARRDGDEERAAQLRAELREGRNGPDNMMIAALDQLEPILRDDQVARLWEMQDRMQRQHDQRDLRRSVMRDLPDELGLDDEQREDFDRLVQGQREQMHERWSEMRPLMEELRQAGQDGDLERVAELRRQIDEARSAPDNQFDEFFKGLEEILSDEQLQRLAEFREKMTGGGRDAQAGPGDVRDVLRAVKRLRLSGEQREQIRKIEREAVGAYRKIDRTDKEEQAILAAEVKADIAEVLDGEQVKQFEEQLRRLGRRSSRRGS